MPGLSLIVLLSLVVYRVTRFLIEDSLIEAQRNMVRRFILWGGPKRIIPDSEIPKFGNEQRGWRGKLYELTSCRFCLSIWISAGAVALTDWQTSVPLPVWVWLAAAAGAVMIWRWVEE